MPAVADATIVLASASPQRRQLLESVALPVQVLPSRIDETLTAGEPPDQAVVRLARRKASAVAGRVGRRRWILAADTALRIGLDLVGKPRDRTAARSISGASPGPDTRSSPAWRWSLRRESWKRRWRLPR